MMNEISYSIVTTTFSSQQEARVMAKKIIAAKLAACVQVDEVESFYMWEGECCDEREFRLQIKTRKELFLKLERFILEHHSYETPEIILCPIIKGSKDYLDWIDSSVSQGS